MEDRHHRRSIGLIAVATMLIPLVWSLGLIGRGIWQLSQDGTTTKNSSGVRSFATVPNVTTGVYNYGGSTAWASLRLAVDSAIQAERPELQLRYVQPQTPPGSSPGIKMLLQGEVAFAQSSHPLSSQEFELARQKGLKLTQVPVAVNGIAVAVHPQLNISGLTLSQLQAIYTGKISNWQELGGADLPITAYSRPPSTGGMVDFFSSKILQNRSFGSNVQFVSTTTEALRQLANDPGGIYYGSATAIVPQCTVKSLPLGEDLVAPYQKPLVAAAECPQRRNQLNIEALRNADYPLTHYLYVVYIENNERSQIGRAYADFLLTPQGQQAIAKAGLIPLD
jgi:phosphate transport system substrate-binding protein